MRAIVFNTNYFKPNTLKFKTFIYIRKSRIIYNFCKYRSNTPPVGVEVASPKENFFTVGIFRKTISKYAKLMVELR